jgi:hypothetical protein
VVGVSPTIVPFLYSKRTAAARSLVSRYGRSIVLSPLRSDQPWTYPVRVFHRKRNYIYSMVIFFICVLLR